MVEIRALTPDLLADYMDFFDHTAFSDHQEWSLCYCTFYHCDAAFERELDGCGEEKLREALRGYAGELIARGGMRGYLAYREGAVVGWCNANDKSAYRRIVEHADLLGEGDPERIKAVTCFTIAPAMRGQGIATALLERVCADARAEGYACVEAYPANCGHEGSCDVFANYHGHLRMYEKAGFAPVREFAHGHIVRKML